jgi:acetyl-CoA carboxylase carboxyl transferase subunit beta
MAWFKRKTEGISTSTEDKKEAPDGVWNKCPNCKKAYYFWDDETINDDCVGYGRLKQISNNINFPYFFGTKYFQFCSETNPLL